MQLHGRFTCSPQTSLDAFPTASASAIRGPDTASEAQRSSSESRNEGLRSWSSDEQLLDGGECRRKFL